MAKIWYAQEGRQATIGGPRCELPLIELLKLSEKFPGEYLSNKPPKFPSSKPILDGYRDPEFVVVEITEEDLKEDLPGQFGFHLRIRPGFYRVKMPVQECEQVLSQHHAESSNDAL